MNNITIGSLLSSWICIDDIYPKIEIAFPVEEPCGRNILKVIYQGFVKDFLHPENNDRLTEDFSKLKVKAWDVSHDTDLGESAVTLHIAVDKKELSKYPRIINSWLNDGSWHIRNSLHWR